MPHDTTKQRRKSFLEPANFDSISYKQYTWVSMKDLQQAELTPISPHLPQLSRTYLRSFEDGGWEANSAQFRWLLTGPGPLKGSALTETTVWAVLDINVGAYAKGSLQFLCERSRTSEIGASCFESLITAILIVTKLDYVDVTFDSKKNEEKFTRSIQQAAKNTFEITEVFIPNKLLLLLKIGITRSFFTRRKKFVIRQENWLKDDHYQSYVASFKYLERRRARRERKLLKPKTKPRRALIAKIFFPKS